MATSKSYPCIRAWEKMMGAAQYYIDLRLEQAREENAPEDATYKSGTTWHRLNEVTSESTRNYFREHYPELVSQYCPEWK